MLFGGGLTLDFAENRVDFSQSLATTSITIELFRENNSLVSDLLAIVKLSRINAYVDVLKPIAEMVIDLQAEKEHTSNKILGHAVTIWLHLQAMMTLEDGCSLYRISLRQQHSCTRNFF
uniref:Uncharacterized protein n=1 Tax=Ditylenchus dipsaci TaxID=166011 RepID=A0A915EMH2_9BILA